MTKKSKNSTLGLSESLKRVFKAMKRPSPHHFSMRAPKLIELFDQKNLKKLRAWTKIPNAEERKRLTNERILASLRGIGVAPQSEVDELRAKLERLEAASSKNRPRSRV
jgi:hypothetical protein